MDDLLRDAKERLLLEGQTAYIAINVAGGAALLAFLQAIWPQAGATSLKKGVLVGLAAFACGIAVATCSYLARHIALRRNQLVQGIFFQIAYMWIPLIAIACFVVGLLCPVFGGFDSLSSQSDRPSQVRSAPEAAKKR